LYIGSREKIDFGNLPRGKEVQRALRLLFPKRLTFLILASTPCQPCKWNPS
jgi:hypothetical protein